MYDIPTDTITPSEYECLYCGSIVTADTHPGDCLDCGDGGFQNRAMSLE